MTFLLKSVLLKLSLTLHALIFGNEHMHAVFQKDGDVTFILGTNPTLQIRNDSNKLKELHTSNRERRNAILHVESLWPGAIIPYEISSVFNGR